MLDSIWAQQVTFADFPPLKHNAKTDVLIVGGGMAGLLCASLLTRDGVDCMLIEADALCGGVTRNTTAKITSQHGLIYDSLLRRFDADTARLYWKANEAAVQAYRTLAEVIPCGLETMDNYIYAEDSPKELEQELTTLQKLGIPADYVKTPSIPMDTCGAVRFREQAQFHPLLFASGLTKGLKIYTHTPAREFVGNTVVTDRGRIRAKKIIVATHFPMLNKHGGYFLKMYQHRSYVLALKQAGKVDGMYLGAGEGGLSFRNWGEYLLLGGGGHRTGKKGGGWAALEAFAEMRYPQSAAAFRWATQDCMTLDGIPYIGRYGKRTPDLFVAAGFNKWGMSSSMVAAMVLRDLVQERENPYAEVFSPARTVLRPQLFFNIAESARNLLTPTTPRCPHLGCALKWNPQEHSWDCPCHGSRFTETGKLLDNPATDDLHQK